MEDVKKRIAKLLALVESPNENEARVAMLKARELMAEHKLRPEQIKDATSLVVVKKYLRDITFTKMTDPWTVELAVVIAEHYCCKCLRSHQKYGKAHSVVIIGFEEDADVCIGVFRYAYNLVKTKTNKIRAENKREPASFTRRACNAYGYGFTAGVQQAFNNQSKEHEEWGLVLVTPPAVLDEIKRYGKGTVFASPESDRGLSLYRKEGIRDGIEFNPSSKLAQPQQRLAASQE